MIVIWLVLLVQQIFSAPTLDARHNDDSTDDSALAFTRQLYNTIREPREFFARAHLENFAWSFGELHDDDDDDDEEDILPNEATSFTSQETSYEHIFQFDFPTKQEHLYSEFRIFFDHLKNKRTSDFHVNLFETSKQRTLLGKVLVSADATSQWLVFRNIVNTLSQKRITLEIEVVTLEGVTIPLSKCGIIGSNDKEEQRAFITRFYNTHDTIEESSKTRKRRSLSEHLSAELAKQKATTTTTKTSGCSVDKFYVDFETIGWSNIIISPEGFQANICRGSCNNIMNNSPHAVLQTIVHHVYGNVPKPCCAPSHTLPLSVLMLDENNNPTLKTYSDMIVGACQCQ